MVHTLAKDHQPATAPRFRIRLACLAGTLWLGGAIPAAACDALVGRLLANMLTPAIAGIDCGVLRRGGVDRPHHSLGEVCYTSQGEVSTLEVSAQLKCKTGDQAFIPVTIAEDVRVVAGIRGTDCQLTEFRLTAGGVLGQVLLSALNAPDALRAPLQAELTRVCTP